MSKRCRGNIVSLVKRITVSVLIHGNSSKLSACRKRYIGDIVSLVKRITVGTLIAKGAKG